MCKGYSQPAASLVYVASYRCMCFHVGLEILLILIVRTVLLNVFYISEHIVEVTIGL